MYDVEAVWCEAVSVRGLPGRQYGKVICPREWLLEVALGTLGSHVTRGLGHDHRNHEALVELHLALLLAVVLHRLLDLLRGVVAGRAKVSHF